MDMVLKPHLMRQKKEGTIFYSTQDKGLYYCDGDKFVLMSSYNELKTSSTDLQTLINSVESRVSALEGNETSDDLDVANLQAAVSGLTSTTASMQTDISNLQSTTGSLQSDVSSLQGSVTTLQGDVATLQSQTSTLEGNVSTLQTQVSTIPAPPGVSSNFILKSLPFAKTTETNWGNLQHQCVAVIANSISNDPTHYTLWSTPPSYPFPYDMATATPPTGIIAGPTEINYWLNTQAFNLTWYNPMVDTYRSGGKTIYGFDTRSQVTMTTDTIQTRAIVKIDVAKLTCATTRDICDDFNLMIASKQNVMDLGLGHAEFTSLWTKASNYRLPDQKCGMLYNSGDFFNNLELNPYLTDYESTVQESWTSMTKLITDLLGAIPVIGKYASVSLASIGKVIDATTTGSPSNPASGISTFASPNALPFVKMEPKSYPISVLAKTSNEDYITYNYEESYTLPRSGSFGSPVNRTDIYKFRPQGSPATYNQVTGPFVDGVITVGTGYAVRARMDQTIKMYDVRLNNTNFYKNAKTTILQGNDGLLAAGSVKIKTGAISKGNSTLDGACEYNYTGNWDASKTYSTFDIAVYLGTSYACIISPPTTLTSATTPLADPINWEPVLNYQILKQPSVYKYAQFRIDLNINKENLTDISGNDVPTDWNAVYVNDVLYGVFNGKKWVYSDNLINP